MRDGSREFTPPKTDIREMIKESMEELPGDVTNAEKPLNPEFFKGEVADFAAQAKAIDKSYEESGQSLPSQAEAIEKAYERDKKVEAKGFRSQAEGIDVAYAREGGKSFDSRLSGEKHASQREIWQHEENLRERNHERLTLQEQLRGLEAQEYKLSRDLLSAGEDAPRDEFWAVRKDIKSLRKRMAEVIGEMTESTSLINSLQKSIDVIDVGFTKEEEAWFNTKESAREKIEEQKRDLQRQLIGSSRFLNEQMAARDRLIVEKDRAERESEERKAGSWLEKVKAVFKRIGPVRNMDNEIARMNGEIEASFGKAESLVKGIKALDALLEGGKGEKLASLKADFAGYYSRVREEREEKYREMMRELAREMGVELKEEGFGEEVKEEPMKKAA